MANVTLESLVPRRRLRVVVVDDEVPILRIYRRILGRHYDVVAAPSSEAALELLAEGADVVFCDLLLPGMTGLELHAAVRARDPELASRIVFVTGCVDCDRLRAHLGGLPNLIVEKPFSVRDILAAVDRVCFGGGLNGYELVA